MVGEKKACQFLGGGEHVLYSIALLQTPPYGVMGILMEGEGSITRGGSATFFSIPIYMKNSFFYNVFWERVIYILPASEAS